MNPLLQKLLVLAALLFIATDAFADDSATPTPKPLAKGIIELLVKNNDLTGNPALDLTLCRWFSPKEQLGNHSAGYDGKSCD